MPREPITFTYSIRSLEDGREFTFKVVLDGDTLEERGAAPERKPPWTRLEVAQCGVCPLKRSESPYCPAALSLVDFVETVGDLISYTQVEVTVETEERTIITQTTMQRVLSSLLGLRMAGSGCPILAKFRPMARFHLPFASHEETVFRATSAYLLAQYFLLDRGKVADLELEGLRRIYDDVHGVNVGLAERLQGLATGDANVNAVVLLDLFAQSLPLSIDKNLRDLQHIFASYFDDAPKTEP